MTLKSSIKLTICFSGALPPSLYIAIYIIFTYILGETLELSLKIPERIPLGFYRNHIRWNWKECLVTIVTCSPFALIFFYVLQQTFVVKWFYKSRTFLVNYFLIFIIFVAINSNYCPLLSWLLVAYWKVMGFVFILYFSTLLNGHIIWADSLKLLKIMLYANDNFLSYIYSSYFLRISYHTR